MKMKMQMQSGGEFADHELVKLASKVVDGVSRPPSTPFEKILVLYDKMKGVKNERKLTAKEQRIFDRVDAVVQQEFDAMFRRAEPMLKSIEKRPGSQSGGQETTAPAAPADTEGVNPGENQQAPAQTKSTADPEGAKPEENQPKQEASTEEKPESAPADPAAAANPGTVAAAAAAAQSSAASAAAAAQAPVPAATATAQAQAAPAAAAASGKSGGTFFMNTNRFIAVLWQSLKGIWDWVKSFFVGTMDDKMKEFMKIFNPAYLMAMIRGTTAEETAKNIEDVDAKVKGSIQKLQTTVVSGISGAASASIDMVLNAFSMMPAFGTVLLVWRMFQNLLVIMGATLSVQAGKDELTGNFYKEGVKNPGAASAIAKKVEATKPGTGGDGELNPDAIAVNDSAEPVKNPAAEGPGQAQAQGHEAEGQGQAPPAAQGQGPATAVKTVNVADVGGGGRAGRRRVSSSMTKKINLETRRFKKSLKRYLHLRVPGFMPGGGGGGGGSSAFKSGYAAL